MRLGITGKWLAVVLPLVVLPCLITGLLGYIAAEGIVTRLLNQAQISLAREIAEQIGRDFTASEADLQLIARLPVLEDYYYNRFYGLDSEAEISRKQVEEFFRDVARKSSLYHRISYLDQEGREVAGIEGGRIVETPGLVRTMPFPRGLLAVDSPGTYISAVEAAGPDQPRVVRLAHPLFDVWNKLSGAVLLELDIDELSRRILARRVGLQGYAFVVDQTGRVLIHPENRHLGLRPDELEEPSVEVLIRTMLRERQGLDSYYYEGRKIAAFTEVPGRDWIIAVTLPVAEFKAHVLVIKKQVFQIVVAAGSLALVAGIIVSWHFLRPIKNLARATKVIAEGRLPQKVRFESSDELGALTSSFNRMVENLRFVQAELVKSEKLVSLGRLAAGVAHEIRNPLNTIKVALDVLRRRNEDNPNLMEFTGMIAEEVRRVDHFLSDFLSYARQPPLKPAPTNVNEMLEEILASHSTQAEERGVTLHKKLDPTLPPIPLDPFQMERAIINVVANALEAMDRGGRLTVSTKMVAGSGPNRDGAVLKLSISDTGPGLTQEELRNVFDPFYTTKELGTGLGLSLTQSIIESHQGRIQIESSPGQGTLVVITLPQNLAPRPGETEDE
ncbi:MAG: ATP-binding protein [Thermodesulfobacteriota bacterium]